LPSLHSHIQATPNTPSIYFFWKHKFILKITRSFPSMPDPFFSNPKSTKKRKRSDSTSNGSSLALSHSNKKLALVRTTGNKKRTPAITTRKKKTRDEELSDQTDDNEGEGLDGLDLRAEEEDLGKSGDEDENETPAEKRLRLAQLYIDNLKTSLGTPGGFLVCEHTR
jgi:ribosomal RNA-processing protein 9